MTDTSQEQAELTLADLEWDLNIYAYLEHADRTRVAWARALSASQTALREIANGGLDAVGMMRTASAALLDKGDGDDTTTQS